MHVVCARGVCMWCVHAVYACGVSRGVCTWCVDVVCARGVCTVTAAHDKCIPSTNGYKCIFRTLPWSVDHKYKVGHHYTFT